MQKQAVKFEPLKIWRKAKELRDDYYKKYLEAKEKGGIRYAGGAVAFHPVAAALGQDVYNLTGEPYGATCAFIEPFGIAVQEACDKAGIPRDLCAYARNYWGSILLDKYLLSDGTVISGWPKPDFFYTMHLCCSHAKWYQYAGELEGGIIPTYAIDLPLLDPRDDESRFQLAVDYGTQQTLESIPWMEKITGREWNFELFCETAENDNFSRSLWSKIFVLNQNVPAPLEEKSMFSFYVFNSLAPHWKSTRDFYLELKDEIEDRVKRGIGAITPEKFRFITDAQPAWAFLEIYTYLEQEFGAVSVGSLYSSQFGAWWLDENENLIPAPNFAELNIDLKSMKKEQAVRTYVEYFLRGSNGGAYFQSNRIKPVLMKSLYKLWKAQAVIMHLNRGCEGLSAGQMQDKLDLAEAEIPVFTYEGNMGDPRDYDLGKIKDRVETFMDSLGVKKIFKS